MLTRNKAWVRVLIAGGCLFQLSSCIGDPGYFIVSTAANRIAATTVRLIFNILF